MAILSVSETHRLDALEGVIERGKAAFVEVGEALLEIRDRRLYRESHGTFEAYCSERWGFTHTYAKHLITASRVVSAIGSQTDTTVSVPTPRNESVARELAPVLREAPEKVAETWQHAVDTYGPQPTAAQVRSIVRDEPHPGASERIASIIDDTHRDYAAVTALNAIHARLASALHESVAFNETTVQRCVDAGAATFRGPNSLEERLADARARAARLVAWCDETARIFDNAPLRRVK